MHRWTFITRTNTPRCKKPVAVGDCVHCNGFTLAVVVASRRNDAVGPSCSAHYTYDIKQTRWTHDTAEERVPFISVSYYNERQSCVGKREWTEWANWKRSSAEIQDNESMQTRQTYIFVNFKSRTHEIGERTRNINEFAKIRNWKWLSEVWYQLRRNISNLSSRVSANVSVVKAQQRLKRRNSTTLFRSQGVAEVTHQYSGLLQEANRFSKRNNYKLLMHIVI